MRPPPAEQPDRAVNPEHDEPTLQSYMETLSFDSGLLEASTDDPIVVSSRAMLFSPLCALPRRPRHQLPVSHLVFVHPLENPIFATMILSDRILLRSNSAGSSVHRSHCIQNA